jgi:hypothetical protein
MRWRLPLRASTSTFIPHIVDAAKWDIPGPSHPPRVPPDRSLVLRERSGCYPLSVRRAAAGCTEKIAACPRA